MFHRTDFGGFLVCCYKAIQQLNGVEKNSVAISLMLNHNLTGLKRVLSFVIEFNTLRAEATFSRCEFMYLKERRQQL